MIEVIQPVAGTLLNFILWIACRPLITLFSFFFLFKSLLYLGSLKKESFSKVLKGPSVTEKAN